MSAKPEQREVEFIILVAMLTSLVALSIDTMLPALVDIGTDLNTLHDNDRQQVISVLFLGFAIGQVFFGPLSDHSGRKPAIGAGLLLFCVGSVISIVATDFNTMLMGRFLQGLGVAGPRVVVLALVRDCYEGRAMARVMSFAMAVFILGPILGPAIGQAVLLVSDWRGIFQLLLGFALFTLLWFYWRQPETLPQQRRVKLTAARLFEGFAETCKNRGALAYTLASGFVFSAFLGFLVSIQQIFQELYHLGDLFALYFAVLAFSVGVASLMNAKLVLRYGMRALCWWATVGMTVLSAGFFVYALLLGHTPALGLFMLCFVAMFFCVGILFGNLNSLAMEPLGHIAGMAASVIGCLSTLISLVFGSLIGAYYNATVLPLLFGFTVFGLLTLLTLQWAAGSSKPLRSAS